jgi:hypothetical protein
MSGRYSYFRPRSFSMSCSSSWRSSKVIRSIWSPVVSFMPCRILVCECIRGWAGDKEYGVTGFCDQPLLDFRGMVSRQWADPKQVRVKAFRAGAFQSSRFSAALCQTKQQSRGRMYPKRSAIGANC